MNLGDTAKPLGDGIFGRRFYLVGYLPVYAAALFLLLIIWAGARGWHAPAGQRIDFGRAWSRADSLSLGQALVLLLGVTLLAVLLQPLQLALLRLLEGDWRLPGLSRAGYWWQGRRRESLRKQARLAGAFPADTAPSLDSADVQRAGVAGRRLRQRFPLPDHLLKPTALGNVLAAMEDTAGRQYGMDAVIVWPRLYPLLGDSVKSVVDDRRDTLDASARMTVVMGVTAIVSFVLLLGAGWWLFLALLPVALAWLACRGAVQGALAYSEAVQVAFDLHRSELLEALRIARPASPASEENLHRQWSDFWRQGIPLRPDVDYELTTNEHHVVLREKKL